MLIDFHVHCFPDKLAAGAVGSLHKASGYPYYTDGTLADTARKARRVGRRYRRTFKYRGFSPYAAQCQRFCHCVKRL